MTKHSGSLVGRWIRAKKDGFTIDWNMELYCKSGKSYKIVYESENSDTIQFIDERGRNHGWCKSGILNSTCEYFELCSEVESAVETRKRNAEYVLKRLAEENTSPVIVGKGVDSKALTNTPTNAETQWTDKHYDNWYKLTPEDIKLGKVRVDAYMVNRTWKINSWDDTGAAFHVLKTLTRICNCKNSLERELRALQEQINCLVKLHKTEEE